MLSLVWCISGNCLWQLGTGWALCETREIKRNSDIAKNLIALNWRQTPVRYARCFVKTNPSKCPARGNRLPLATHGHHGEENEKFGEEEGRFGSEVSLENVVPKVTLFFKPEDESARCFVLQCVCDKGWS